MCADVLVCVSVAHETVVVHTRPSTLRLNDVTLRHTDIAHTVRRRRGSTRTLRVGILRVAAQKGSHKETLTHAHTHTQKCVRRKHANIAGQAARHTCSHTIDGL